MELVLLPADNQYKAINVFAFLASRIEYELIYPILNPNES